MRNFSTPSQFLRECDSNSSSLRRTDIRKPATHKAQIHRPATSNSNSNTAPGTPSDARSSDQDPVQYTEPVSDDEDEDDNRLVATTVDEAAWAQLPPEAAAEAKAHREELAKMVKTQVHQAGPSNGNGVAAKSTKEIFPKLTPANLVKLLESRYDREGDRNLNESGEADPNASGFSVRPGRTEYVSSFRAQEGKRIAIPVRIEPKVFYANERTSELSSLLPLLSTLAHSVSVCDSPRLDRILCSCFSDRHWNPFFLRPSR